MVITSFFSSMKSYQFIMFLVLVQMVLGFIVLKSKYRNYIGQILISTSILTIGIAFYLITYQFPIMGSSSSATTAATVPRLWIVLLVPSSIIYLMDIFRRSIGEDPEVGRIDVVCLIIILLIISIILFKYIGYYISTVLFLSICMYYLGYKKVKTIGIISLGWILFTYLVFHKILYVPLPVGKIFELLT